MQLNSEACEAALCLPVIGCFIRTVVEDLQEHGSPQVEHELKQKVIAITSLLSHSEYTPGIISSLAPVRQSK